jgi:hypothetical protein
MKSLTGAGHCLGPRSITSQATSMLANSPVGAAAAGRIAFSRRRTSCPAPPLRHYHCLLPLAASNGGQRGTCSPSKAPAAGPTSISSISTSSRLRVVSGSGSSLPAGRYSSAGSCCVLRPQSAGFAATSSLHVVGQLRTMRGFGTASQTRLAQHVSSSSEEFNEILRGERESDEVDVVIVGAG